MLTCAALVKKVLSADIPKICSLGLESRLFLYDWKNWIYKHFSVKLRPNYALMSAYIYTNYALMSAYIYKLCIDVCIYIQIVLLIVSLIDAK